MKKFVFSLFNIIKIVSIVFAGLLFNVLRIISITFTWLLLIFSVGVITIPLIINEPHSAREIEREFIKYQDDIVDITNYLIKNQYDTVNISDTMERGMCFAYNNDSSLGRIGRDMKIDNTNIAEKISYLFQKCHYQNICKENNVIIFQRWANIQVNSGGLVYIMNGEYPQIPFISKYEPLKYKGWYYYETDSETGDDSIN